MTEAEDVLLGVLSATDELSSLCEDTLALPFIMPKWQLFHSLSLLAHVREVRVRLHPGRVASEGCRQLACMLHSNKLQQKFPGLRSRVELLG